MCTCGKCKNFKFLVEYAKTTRDMVRGTAVKMTLFVSDVGMMVVATANGDALGRRGVMAIIDGVMSDADIENQMQDAVAQYNQHFDAKMNALAELLGIRLPPQPSDRGGN